MIRNPYATASSVIAKNCGNKANLFKRLRYYYPHCRRWNYIAKIGNERNKEDKRYSVIKFENLIMHPQSTIEKICSLLDIQFEFKMLKINKINSSFENDYEAINKSFDINVIDSWKKKLKPTDKKLIKMICRNKYLYNY